MWIIRSGERKWCYQMLMFISLLSRRHCSCLLTGDIHFIKKKKTKTGLYSLNMEILVLRQHKRKVQKQHCRISMKWMTLAGCIRSVHWWCRYLIHSRFHPHLNKALLGHENIWIRWEGGWLVSTHASQCKSQDFFSRLQSYCVDIAYSLCARVGFPPAFQKHAW